MCTSKRKINPLIPLDYPDPDVIRVEDTYYMVSTTMHFMPGCVILKSYNLVDWEIETYVYETLDETETQCLQNGENAYGQGMWAATLRHYEGMFYIVFVANDTGKTYLFRSQNIRGPWKKNIIDGFYHDCSLLFEDGKAYLAYGNRQIYIVELNKELTAPEKGGLRKLVVEDQDDVRLGYEGTHWYKIDGKYYMFFIHWHKAEGARRCEACYVSDRLAGPYTGRDILDTDGGYCNQGVAQGGIVDTPEGKWYGILFRDMGAVGRLPVLVPVSWEEDFPIFGIDGKVPDEWKIRDCRPGYKYAPLYGDDDFDSIKEFWQWNHVPDKECICIGKDGGENTELCVYTSKVCHNVTQAPNTLTQRLIYPGCQVTVTVDGTHLGDGDVAGMCLLQGDYGVIGIMRDGNQYELVQLKRPGETNGSMGAPEDQTIPEVVEKCLLDDPSAKLRVTVDFTNMRDIAYFEVKRDGKWQPFGKPMKLYFKLDHFCGVRIGLCCYATKQAGGHGAFRTFRYIPT